MVVTRLGILQNVQTILEIGKEGQKLLIDHGISSVRKLRNTTDEAYQYLVYEKQYNFFDLDKNKREK